LTPGVARCFPGGMSQADRAVEAVKEARALLQSWYHDPDCSAGRRELQHFEGEKVCFHFDKRLRHQCAEALLAVLDGADEGRKILEDNRG